MCCCNLVQWTLIIRVYSIGLDNSYTVGRSRQEAKGEVSVRGDGIVQLWPYFLDDRFNYVCPPVQRSPDSIPAIALLLDWHQNRGLLSQPIREANAALRYEVRVQGLRQDRVVERQTGPRAYFETSTRRQLKLMYSLSQHWVKRKL